MAAGLARLDRASGDLDRAREQQQLFGQRGFTRIGVGDDGKGAAAAGFSEKRHEWCAMSGQGLLVVNSRQCRTQKSGKG
jgi:hypothetical protein